MSKGPVLCPECATPVGAGTNVDPYKHLIACLHVPAAGVEALSKEYERGTDERSRRIMTLLAAVKGG